MNTIKFRLRTVTPGDAQQLLSIYAPCGGNGDLV